MGAFYASGTWIGKGNPGKDAQGALGTAAAGRYSGGVGLSTHDFDYELPAELIADRPLPDRAASRLMVVHRESGEIEHRIFREFPGFIDQENDLLVLNDTKVIPARVFSDDGKIELLCLDRLAPCQWQCLAKPGRKTRVGREVVVDGIRGVVIEVLENGDRVIQWDAELDLDKCGHLALPHYMGREEEERDRDRYQTVYARKEGAIAAPTAGLHFTPEMLGRLPHAFLTLHVGVGTFRPVKAEHPEEHVMHRERYAISGEAARRINEAGRIIAVGTTVTRVLEHLGGARNGGRHGMLPRGDQAGETGIFLYPPYQFRVVDGLLTNFHLPESTLIMLVSALAGRELILRAYREAVREHYRFYSYGDCMLIV